VVSWTAPPVIAVAMVLMVFAATVVMMPVSAGIVAAVIRGVSAGVWTRCGAVIARAAWQKERHSDYYGQETFHEDPPPKPGGSFDEKTLLCLRQKANLKGFILRWVIGPWVTNLQRAWYPESALQRCWRRGSASSLFMLPSRWRKRPIAHRQLQSACGSECSCTWPYRRGEPYKTAP